MHAGKYMSTIENPADTLCFNRMSQHLSHVLLTDLALPLIELDLGISGVGGFMHCMQQMRR